MVDAAGQTVKIGDGEALDTYKIVKILYAGFFSGRPVSQVLEVIEGVKFKYQK